MKSKEQLIAENRILSNEVHRLNKELRIIYGSKSWKLTKHYRALGRYFRRVFKIKEKSHEKIILNTDKKLETLNKKIAIQVHVFYPELLDELYSNMKKVPYDFDLYISTDTNDKKKKIDKFFKDKDINVFVEVFENLGRDILPFILQLKNKINEYDYVCHLHTKKSKHSDFGDNWRKYLYYNLFGTTDNLKSIFYLFEKNKKLGIIYPKTYYILEQSMDLGSNGDKVYELSKRFDIPNNFDNVFPAGSMFWAKTEAMKPLFEVLDKDDFEVEDGQVDGTCAHAIERMLVMLPQGRGYDYLQITNNTEKKQINV